MRVRDGLLGALTDLFGSAAAAVTARVRLCAAPALAAAALLMPVYADEPVGPPVSAPSGTIPQIGSRSDLTDTVHYESDFIDYDNGEQILYLFGKARVKYQNISLLADTIVYTVSNNQFQARGKPTLIEGNDTTAGDFMAYNIKTKRGRVSYATTRFDDTYVTGSNIIKTPDNCLYIEQGDYTTCQNPEHPHYYFYGRHIKFIPNEMVITRPVVFNVGDAPVAVLPYFIMPLQRGRRSGWLTPSWGGSVAHGGYVDNLGYYFAPNDYYDLTLRTKVQEFNSFVFNAGGRYALRYRLDGQISGRYVVDNRLETSSQQWALDYRHNHLLTPDGKTRLSGQGSILSTRTFNQMYSDETYDLEKQQLDANMSLSQKFDKLNASANLTWRRNHNLTTDRIIEDMPSLDFNLQNRAFIPYKTGGPKDEPSWYNNVYYSYNTRANLRRDAYGSDSLPGFIRPGMDHKVNLTSSQKVLKYLDISPYFNMRASMFYGAIDTLVRDTLYLRDTLVYQVKDPLADTRAPEYSLISAVPEYFINVNGDLDTLYTVVKVSPERRHFVRDTLNNEFNTVSSWNTGVNMSTRIYGLFHMGGILGVTAIRHTMTPTVGYAYVPTHELNRTFYNVGIDYDRARPKAQQLVNFSLSNTFQGKRTVSVKETGGGRRPGGAKVNTGARHNAGGIDAEKISVVEEMTSDGNNVGYADDAESINNVNNVSDINNINNINNAGNINDTNNINNTNDINNTGDAGDGADGINNIEDAENISPDTSAASAKTAAAKKEEKFDLLTLSVSTSYDFEADRRNWRDISLNAGTSVSILNVGFTSAFWLYDQNDELKAPIMRSYSLDLTSGRLGASGKFWDGDLLNLDMTAPGQPVMRNRAGARDWNVNFSPSFSYRASRSTPDEMFLPAKSFNISSSAGLNLTEAISVKWNGNYDFSSSRFSHNNFTFYMDLECWEMRFTWRPEKINPGFHFVINIKKIPDIKWEERESRTTRVL